MQKTKTYSLSIPTKYLIYIVLLLGILLVLSFSINLQFHLVQPFHSVELAFTDPSLNSGLSIVPASCPSSPDYSGECSGGQCDNGYTNYPTCGPTAPPNNPPVGFLDSANCAPGGIAGWAQDPDSPSTPIGVHLYIDGPAGGGGTVFAVLTAIDNRPDLCSRYGCNHGYSYTLPDIYRGTAHTIYAYGIDAAGGANTLLLNSPRNIQCSPPTCPDGTPVPADNICRSGPICQSPNVLYNGQCVPPGCDNILKWFYPSCNPVTAVCTPPSILSSTECIQCLSGSTWNGSSCVVTSCPAGYALVGGVCQKITTVCQPGYIDIGGVCTQQCQLICNGSTLTNQCNNQSTVCSYGCTTGACLPPPPVTIQAFLARPSLVRREQPATIAWEVIHAQSCTITSSNGDSWNGLSGKYSSSGITSQTIFTLSCIPLVGAKNSDGSDYIWQDLFQTVNVTPQFQGM